MVVDLIVETGKVRLNYKGCSILVSIKDGHLNLDYLDHDLALNGATSALFLLNERKDLVLILKPQFLSAADFQPIITPISNSIGTGQQIRIKCIFCLDTQFISSSTCKISGEWICTMYEPNMECTQPFVTIQIKLTEWLEDMNQAGLFGYAPLYMDQGDLKLNLTQPQSPQDITFYSNGYQSWSVNYLMDYKKTYKSAPIQMIRINMENQDKTISAQFQSEWHTAITNIPSQNTLILGFLSLKDQYSRILMDHLKGSTTIQKLIAYSQTDGIPLAQLNSGLKQSELLMIFFSKPGEGYEGLRQLCQLSGRLQNAKVNLPAIAGWCSWYYYYTKISEKEMLSNLEFFQKHPELPIELIQLDDGYQTAISDWGIDEPYTFNEKFPHGLAWLVDQIHQAQFKAGLWVAPFFTTPKSKFYQQHTDWVLKDQKLKPVKTTYNWGAFQYALDLSQEEVVSHVERLANTITHKWNFDFLKIDFIFASEALSGKYKNPIFSRAQILRRGVEAIRRGLGPDKFLLGCGAPLGPCVGLVDAMRISNDTAAVWEMLPLLGKLGKVAVPALKPALKSIIQRSYMHNTYWTNDPDCVVVRKNRSKLSLDEVQLQLTVFGLSGGQVLISDDMPLVDTERIDLLKRLFPIYKNCASPFDALENDYPTLYGMTENTKIGTRHLCVVINWENQATERNLKLKSLITHSAQDEYTQESSFLIYDYWNEAFLGIHKWNETLTLQIPPHAGIYLSIIPFDGKNPQIISSTLHILQGILEIAQVTSSETEMKIQIKLPGDHEGDLIIFDPKKRQINWDKTLLVHKAYLEGNISILELKIHEKSEIVLNFIKGD